MVPKKYIQLQFNSSNILLLAVLFLFGIGLYFFVTPVRAAMPAIELDGYAWSENIGWISLNCKTGSSSGGNICGTRNYKVTVNADQTITGFAWSEYIGWIKFGGLSAFPTGGGTTNSNARVDGSYPNLTFKGWARACAGTREPLGAVSKDCSSMTNNSDNSGGWDGWISLGGTGYSVSANGAGMVSGSYAWGSDVVGWIDMFTHVVWITPTANLAGTGCTIPRGSGTCNGTLTWSFIPSTTPNPSIVRTSPALATPISNLSSRSAFLTTLSPGNNTFIAKTGTVVVGSPVTLLATCDVGDQYNPTTKICEMTPNTPPTVSVSADPRIVRMGQTVEVTWTVTDLLDGSCKTTGPGMGNVTVPSSGTGNGTITSDAIYNFTRFGISCTGSYGTVEAFNTAEVVPTAQEI